MTKVKNIVAIFLLGFIFTIKLTAVQSALDSMTALIPNSKIDTNLVKLYSDIAFEYSYSNPDKGIEYGKMGLQTAQTLGWEIGQALCYNALGVNYRYQGEYKKAISEYKKALTIFESVGDKVSIGVNYNNVGNIYLNQSDFINALDNYRKAERIFKDLNDKGNLQLAIGNIGIVFAIQSDYLRALNNFFESLSINEALGNKTNMASDLINIGGIYRNQSDYTKALEYYNRALLIVREQHNKYGEASTTNNIGTIYRLKGEYDKAFEFINQSSEIFKEINNKQGLADNFHSLGLLFFEKADYLKAVAYHNRALDIEKKLDDKYGIAQNLGAIGKIYFYKYKKSPNSNLSRQYLNNSIKYLSKSIDILIIIGELHKRSEFIKILAEAYEVIGENKKALHLNKEFTLLQDSIFNKDKVLEFSRLEFNHEIAMRELNAARLQEIKEKEAKLFRTILIIIVSFILLIAVVAIIGYLNKRKLNKFLEETNNVLDSKNRELEIITNIINNDLNKASDYVQSLLEEPIKEGRIKTDWRFLPSSQIGGDIFGYKWLDDENFIFFVIDSSGHGVGSALHSVSALNTINTGSLPDTDYRKPEQVLTALNKLYQSSEHSDIYFTMFYCVYNITLKLLNYCGAGHPPIILIDEKLNTRTIKSENIFVGAIPNFQYQSGVVQIESNTNIYLYSDGVYEVKKTDGQMWEFDEFISCLSSEFSTNSKELDKLLSLVKELSGTDSLEDDFSILKVNVE